jgi:hypothetical protein
MFHHPIMTNFETTEQGIALFAMVGMSVRNLAGRT